MRETIFKGMRRVLVFITDKLLTPAFWIFLIFGFDEVYVAILTVISALIHEGGHLLTAGFRTSGMRYTLSGPRISGGVVSYRKRILTLAGGPVANLLTFFIAIPFFGIGGGYVSVFGFINLATALSNLLPIEGYDGHGIFTEALGLAGVDSPERIPNIVSFALTVILSFFSLYLMMVWDSGYWIFCLFFVSAVRKISETAHKKDFLRN